MRLYALRDASNEAAGDIAYLECYERERAFYFELPPGADPWSLPFILHEYAQRDRLTVDAYWSLTWVRLRLVPPERQNIGEILRANDLEEYDELKLLDLTAGRCSQDDCYLVPLEVRNAAQWYGDRVEERMLDASPLDGFRLAAVYRNGEIVICDMATTLADRRRFARVMSQPEVFGRVRLQPGGHGVRWGSELLVSHDELREWGTTLPLSSDDATTLLGQQILDASEVASLLGCTRQNVSDLARCGRLTPVKASRHATLFLRSDILAYRDVASQLHTPLA